MPTLISVPFSNQEILIEVDRAEPGHAVTRGGGLGGLVQKAASSFEDGLTRIKPAAAEIVRQLSGGIDGIDSVEVKFGMKFSAEAGAFIASTASEANFEIQIKWSRPRKPDVDSA